MTYLLLGLLGNFALEALRLDAILQHRDLVSVEGFEVVDHGLLLELLLGLGF